MVTNWFFGLCIITIRWFWFKPFCIPTGNGCSKPTYSLLRSASQKADFLFALFLIRKKKKNNNNNNKSLLTGQSLYCKHNIVITSEMFELNRANEEKIERKKQTHERRKTNSSKRKTRAMRPKFCTRQRNSKQSICLFATNTLPHF